MWCEEVTTSWTKIETSPNPAGSDPPHPQGMFLRFSRHHAQIPTGGLTCRYARTKRVPNVAQSASSQWVLFGGDTSPLGQICIIVITRGFPGFNHCFSVQRKTQEEKHQKKQKQHHGHLEPSSTGQKQLHLKQLSLSTGYIFWKLLPPPCAVLTNTVMATMTVTTISYLDNCCHTEEPP